MGYFASSNCNSLSRQELQDWLLRSSFEISKMSIGSTVDKNRTTGMPLLSTRNFSKFHTTSRILNVFQKLSCGLNLASSGRRHRSFRYVYTGDSFSPLTSPIPIISKAGTKPLPGRTYFRPLNSSVALSAGSWWPNWLQGNPSTCRRLSLPTYAFS